MLTTRKSALKKLLKEAEKNFRGPELYSQKIKAILFFDDIAYAEENEKLKQYCAKLIQEVKAEQREFYAQEKK